MEIKKTTIPSKLNIKAPSSSFYFTMKSPMFEKLTPSIISDLEFSSSMQCSSTCHNDLTNVTSVGEIVIARAHVTVLSRFCDAEARWVARGRGIVKLVIQHLVTG